MENVLMDGIHPPRQESYTRRVKPLMIIFDEAEGIDSNLFDIVNNMEGSYWLQILAPTEIQGDLNKSE